MTAQDRRWVKYWSKHKHCKHEWGQAWRKTSNPNTGPLMMICSKCRMPYYRWLQGSWYNRRNL